MANETKFRVGDMVAWLGVTPYGKGPYFGTVIEIDSQTLNMKIRWDNGDLAQYNSNSVVIELIQPETQEPKHKEHVDFFRDEPKELDKKDKIKLPNGPVPGRFYRTRDGYKRKFLIKGVKEYAYETEEGEILNYDTPTKYNKHVTHEMYDDIVGEWTEENALPAVKIKRWAVVFKNKEKLGNFYGTYDSHGLALRMQEMSLYSNDLEIIELTGTLPERKI